MSYPGSPCPKCGMPGMAWCTHICMTTGVPSHVPVPTLGWKCPGCERCYSPSMTICPYCPAREALAGDAE